VVYLRRGRVEKEMGKEARGVTPEQQEGLVFGQPQGALKGKREEKFVTSSKN